MVIREQSQLVNKSIKVSRVSFPIRKESAALSSQFFWQGQDDS